MKHLLQYTKKNIGISTFFNENNISDYVELEVHASFDL